MIAFHTELIKQFNNMLDDKMIILFIWLVIADIATGMTKSFLAKTTNKKLNSSKGLSGLIKHLIVIFLVITIYPYLLAMGFADPARMLVVFYILNYAVSIIENLGEAGIPVPSFVKKYLAKLQDNYNGSDKK